MCSPGGFLWEVTLLGASELSGLSGTGKRLPVAILGLKFSPLAFAEPSGDLKPGKQEESRTSVWRGLREVSRNGLWLVRWWEG